MNSLLWGLFISSVVLIGLPVTVYLCTKSFYDAKLKAIWEMSAFIQKTQGDSKNG